jgi:hypothetical protein
MTPDSFDWNAYIAWSRFLRDYQSRPTRVPRARSASERAAPTPLGGAARGQPRRSRLAPVVPGSTA